MKWQAGWLVLHVKSQSPPARGSVHFAAGPNLPRDRPPFHLPWWKLLRALDNEWQPVTGIFPGGGLLRLADGSLGGDNKS